MMKRVLTIVVAVIVLSAIVLFSLKYYGSQWYLAQENSNFKLLREKSKLNCDQLPIHCAIRDKNYALLKDVTPGDPHIESLNGWTRTALYYAITQGDKESVDILLEKKANPNVYDEHGEPALLYAVKMKMYEVTENLLKHGAQVDIEDIDKTMPSRFPILSPLWSCITSHDKKCVMLLLKYGANVDWHTSRDVTGKKYSIYEAAKGYGNMNEEIMRLIEEKHNLSFKRDALKRAP